MADKLKKITFGFQKRNARKRGAIHSDDWNDSFDEISNDLALLYSLWNDSLFPLLGNLPAGTPDSDINAFDNGLDGNNLYLIATATSNSNSNYYNSANSRPNTVFEQFQDVYSTINTLQEDLGDTLTIDVLTASNIALADTLDLYSSTNVEDALAEIKQDIDALFAGDFLPLSGGTMTGNIDMGGNDLSNVDQIRSVSGTPVTLGNTATSSHALGVDDFIASGDLEVDGKLYPDGGAYFGDDEYIIGEDNGVIKNLISGVTRTYLDYTEYQVSGANLKLHDGQAYGVVNSFTPSTAGLTIDFDEGNMQVIDLGSVPGATLTLEFANPKAGASYLLKIIQDAASPVDITWPSEVKWIDGVAPVISTGASAIDLVSLVYDGSIYMSNIGQNYS